MAPLPNSRTPLGEGAARTTGSRRRHGTGDAGQLLAAAAEPGQRVQQAARVGVTRRPKQFAHLGPLDNPASVHHQHIVANLGHDSEVMGDEQNSHGELALKSAQ